MPLGLEAGDAVEARRGQCVGASQAHAASHASPPCESASTSARSPLLRSSRRPASARRAASVAHAGERLSGCSSAAARPAGASRRPPAGRRRPPLPAAAQLYRPAPGRRARCRRGDGRLGCLTRGARRPCAAGGRRPAQGTRAGGRPAPPAAGSRRRSLLGRLVSPRTALTGARAARQVAPAPPAAASRYVRLQYASATARRLPARRPARAPRRPPRLRARPSRAPAARAPRRGPRDRRLRRR